MTLDLTPWAWCDFALQVNFCGANYIKLKTHEKLRFLFRKKENFYRLLYLLVEYYEVKLKDLDLVLFLVDRR